MYTVSFVCDTPKDFIHLPPLVASDAGCALPDFATWIAVMSHTAVEVSKLPSDGVLGYLGSVVAPSPSGDELLQVAQGHIVVEDLAADYKVQSVLAAIRETINNVEGLDYVPKKSWVRSNDFGDASTVDFWAIGGTRQQ